MSLLTLTRFRLYPGAGRCRAEMGDYLYYCPTFNYAIAHDGESSASARCGDDGMPARLPDELHVMSRKV